jgi:hypothetical protein
MTVAIAAAAIALFVLPLTRQAPAGAPPPAELTRVADTDACPQAQREHEADTQRGVSEISWFQGTLEEAFARHSHSHAHNRPAALLGF